MPARWRWQRRIWAPDVDADVDDELRFHLEQLTADLVARGHEPAEAWRVAQERFGDCGAVRRRLRRHDQRRMIRQRRAETMDTILQDVRYVVRKMLQSRGFTLGVVLILGTGAPFWLVNAVAGVIYAVTMPLVAITTAYVYFDRRVADELEESSEPAQLPPEIELSIPR